MSNKNSKDEYWFIRKSTLIGLHISILYVLIIIIISFFGKDLLLRWFEISKPLTEVMQACIPVIDKHYSSLMTNGYNFEAERSRNIYSLIWLINGFFSSITIIFSIMFKVYSVFIEEKNISNLDSLTAALIIIIFTSFICIFGLNIEYGTSTRRAYRLYDSPYLYLIFTFSVFAIFSCLNVVSHFLRSHLRKLSHGN